MLLNFPPFNEIYQLNNIINTLNNKQYVIIVQINMLYIHQLCTFKNAENNMHIKKYCGTKYLLFLLRKIYQLFSLQEYIKLNVWQVCDCLDFELKTFLQNFPIFNEKLKRFSR